MSDFDEKLKYKKHFRNLLAITNCLRFSAYFICFSFFLAVSFSLVVQEDLDSFVSLSFFLSMDDIFYNCCCFSFPLEIAFAHASAP